LHNQYSRIFQWIWFS